MERRDTKESLTAAAAELLWEHGYAGTSPMMVLKRSNVGQGSMYHHFSGKADLAVAAMQTLSGRLHAKVDAALASHDSAIERIGAYLDCERDPLAGCRMGRLVQDHDIVTDERLRAPTAEFFTWLRGRLSDVLAEGVRTGELRADTDVEALASLVVAAVQGGYVVSRAQNDPDEFRRAVDGVKHALEAARMP